MPGKPSSFRSRLDNGIDNIHVTHWGPWVEAEQAADLVAAFYLSTWGDPTHPQEIPGPESWRLAQIVASGQALPNALESVSATFAFEGVSRATTHQLVRTRVGAGFGQQGGRDNDWSDFNLRLPPTFDTLGDDVLDSLAVMHDLLNGTYKSLLAQGIPTQDARYILPMGLETALVGTYNLLSLKGTLQRRLCNRMMWETNYVARQMADITLLAFPWFGRSLRAGCNRGICASVSPMFPPADLIPYGGDASSTYAADNPTLAHALGESDSTYDNPQEANGCYILFDEIDRARIRKEHEQTISGRKVCVSLVDGDTVLTYEDDGLWRKN